MLKSRLEAFIKKYSLDKECEAAHWYSDAEKKTLTALAHTETKTVILKVTMKDWDGLETCTLALPSASKVKSMLGPIGNDVTITLNKLRDRIMSFTVSDKDCEAICTVSEFDAFPETLDVDTADTPDNFEVEVLLTPEFVLRMSKAISALNDAKDFVVMNNKSGKLDMIINYEDTNTNRIRLPLTTVDGKDQLTVPIGFSTPILRAVINANSEVENAVFQISNRGMGALRFESPEYISKYFLFPTRMID